MRNEIIISIRIDSTLIAKVRSDRSAFEQALDAELEAVKKEMIRLAMKA